jgi:hypothetical protein
VFAQRGSSGELRAGSRLAARFGEWQLVRPDDVLGSDVATIEVDGLALRDEFRFAHDRMDIWLDCGAAWWVWRNVYRRGSVWVTRGGRPEVRVKHKEAGDGLGESVCGTRHDAAVFG